MTLSETWSSAGEYEWTVPDDVYEIHIICEGAPGGDGYGNGSGSNPGDGGTGSRAEKTLSVSPNDSVYPVVGGGGGDGDGSDGGDGGFNGGGDGGRVLADGSGSRAPAGGGGGGGASVVRYPSNSESDRVCIAGGGGGGGGDHDSDSPDRYAGDGGDGDQDGEESDGFNRNDGGGAGSNGSGGSAGGGESIDGDSGGSFDGADGPASYDDDASVGGGGGGGWGGGGSAGDGRHGTPAPGGGGGGSMGDTVVVGGGQSWGSGQITIEWNEPPEEPENAGVDEKGLEEVLVSWDEPSSGGSVDEYTIEHTVNGSWTEHGHTSLTTYTADGLSSDTEYNIRVKATNDEGDSGWVETGTVTTGGAPFDITATGGDGQVDISWATQANPDSIRLLHAEESGSVESDYDEIGVVDDVGSYTDATTDVEGQAYYYRLIAVYPDGDSDPSDEAIGITSLPSPVIEDVSETGDREITIQFKESDNNESGVIEVHRSPGGEKIATYDSGEAEQHIDGDGILDGQEYDYTAVRDTNDETAESEPGSTTTTLHPVANFRIGYISGRFVTLRWADTSNNTEHYDLLLKEIGGEYETHIAGIDGVGEGEEVEVETDELLDGQGYVATVKTVTPDAEAKTDDDDPEEHESLT